MKGKHSIFPYVLIGIGVYFLLKKLNVPEINHFFTWPNIMIIIGVILTIYALKKKSYQNLLGGLILLGVGIHFYGLNNYSFWIDHWAVYIGIIGISLLIRSIWLKSGRKSGFLLTGFALLLILSNQWPHSNKLVNETMSLLNEYWPILLIILGLYLLLKKR